MRLLLFIISIALLSAVAEYFLPWWMIAVIPFCISLAMNRRAGVSFLAGFIGIASFWLLAVLFKDIPNEHILSRRMAIVFKLPNYGILILVVTLIGGVIGGLSAAAGALMREGKN